MHYKRPKKQIDFDRRMRTSQEHYSQTRVNELTLTDTQCARVGPLPNQREPFEALFDTRDQIEFH